MIFAQVATWYAGVNTDALARAFQAIRRHEYNVAMAHAALSNDMVSERFYFGTGSLQNRHLKTAVMIEVDVERRLGKAMMVVEVLGQSLRQLARRMVIDVAQRRDTFRAASVPNFSSPLRARSRIASDRLV